MSIIRDWGQRETETETERERNGPPGSNQLGSVEFLRHALVRGDHNHLVAHLPEVLDEVLEAVLVAGDVGEGRGLDEEGDAAGPGLGRGLVVAGGLRLQVRIGHPDGGRCSGAHKGAGHASS